MDQLGHLDDCKAMVSRLEEPKHVGTPLIVGQWAHYLSKHPDQRLTHFLVEGLERGFRIGFNNSQAGLKKAGSNLLSAFRNQDVVSSYIKAEVSLGRLVGPLPQEVAAQVHISPIGVIPKGHTPGKWCLIVDLSSPPESSVNDGINQAWCSLSYISVDNITRIIARLGRGALLEKMDIKSTYRIVPVHPEDQLLLGIRWQGEVYIDTRLPFGLRSAPIIFTALADALEWIARQQGVGILLHYLDDFITVGSPDSPVCESNMQKLGETCAELGVPVATAKTVDPTTCLTFLGMEVDTDRLELCLPQEKLQRVKQMVQEWMGRKAARRRELESLLGLLQHAAKVVSPGRRFVRRIIQTLTGVRQRDHYVRLGAEIRSDLAWWHRFLDKWNGVGILPTPGMESVHIHSDASGSWGCAVVWGKQWLQWRWNERAQDWHIAPKELLPIILASMVWGSEWESKRVCCHCDNLSVVEVLNNGYSKDATLMHLLRSLFFISEHYQFLVDAVYISLGKRMGELMLCHVIWCLLFSRWCQGQCNNQYKYQKRHSSYW